MNLNRYRNQLNVEPLLVLLLVLALVGGGAFGGKLAATKIDTVKTYDAALTVYDGLIIGADTYVTECAEHVIEQACVPIAQRVFAAAEKAKGAYVALKPFGANPPQNLKDALLAAVQALQLYFA